MAFCGRHGRNLPRDERAAALRPPDCEWPERQTSEKGKTRRPIPNRCAGKKISRNRSADVVTHIEAGAKSTAQFAAHLFSHDLSEAKAARRRRDLRRAAFVSGYCFSAVCPFLAGRNPFRRRSSHRPAASAKILIHCEVESGPILPRAASPRRNSSRKRATA